MDTQTHNKFDRTYQSVRCMETNYYGEFYIPGHAQPTTRFIGTNKWIVFGGVSVKYHSKFYRRILFKLLRKFTVD